MVQRWLVVQVVIRTVSYRRKTQSLDICERTCNAKHVLLLVTIRIEISFLANEFFAQCLDEHVVASVVRL